MVGVKYSISVLKRDPLVKIKVMGIYNENDQYYYRNPVTCCWQKIMEEASWECSTEKMASAFESFKRITCRLKNIADRFYEESKDLFGGLGKELK